MQHRIGGATHGHDHADGVFKRFAGQQIQRTNVGSNGLHQHLSRASSALGFLGIFRRHGGAERQAQPHRFDGRTHRVGREHATTAASSWASVLFNSGELGFIDLAAAQLTNRFKGADHGEVAAAQFAGLDGAAIDEDTWDVHPRHRQHGGGHVFVAAADGQHAIHALTVAGGLDGIGNHFAAHQGVLHPLGAHGDAITDGDGAEELRHPPGCLCGCFGAQG